jgi:hypothetical protein
LSAISPDGKTEEKFRCTRRKKTLFIQNWSQCIIFSEHNFWFHTNWVAKPELCRKAHEGVFLIQEYFSVHFDVVVK